MPMTKLEDVPYQALIAYANEVMQLDVKPGTSKTNIIEKMKVVDETITEIDIVGFSDPVTPPLAPEDGGTVAGDVVNGHGNMHYSHDPKVVVTIMTEAGDGGDRAVPLGVNGDWIIVKRDEEVSIPYRFYEVLENCKATDMRQTEEGGKFTTHRREVRGVQFTVNERPPAAAVAEYLKRTAAINAPQKARWMAKKRQMREAEAA